MNNDKSALQSSGRLSHLTLAGVIVTLGIVFGDIGTSPLYVMKALAAVNPGFDRDYIIGAVSCIIWTLTIQTTLKYVFIALKADNNGEGGILALYALLRKTPHKWIYIVGAIGAAALIADGVITPAVTVTSAVEGLRGVAPDVPVISVTLVIIALIFLLQQAGTGTIGRFFGPFMLLWFTALGVVGALHIPSNWGVLQAFNPLMAIRMLIDYPGWFAVLGAVFLCTTGAEALYSDLGHCGRRNITVSWIYVKAMLIINYLGQGAWMIENHAEAVQSNPFFGIVPQQLTIVAVVLSTGAAIIASQALLSGAFTIFAEAINLGFWPKLRIKYTSEEKGQLYIPAVNMALFAGCVVTVVMFRDSSHMAAAYGLAITVTMIMTTLLLTLWMRTRGVKKLACALFALFFLAIEGIFLVANMAKFMHGGWFTVILAGTVGAVMITYFLALKKRNEQLSYMPIADCVPLLRDISDDSQIAKYASNLIYFSRSPAPDDIESKIFYSIVNKNPKRADHYWFIRIETTDSPYTLSYNVKTADPERIFIVTMKLGFRIEPKVSVLFRQVVEDLVEAGQLNLTSKYPSLAKAGITGDFRFMIIHRIFSPASNCPRMESFILSAHQKLRAMGISDQSAMGLDTSLVTVETVPLVISRDTSRRIMREPQ